MSNDRKGLWPHRFPLDDPERPFRGLFGNALGTPPPKSNFLDEVVRALEARAPSKPARSAFEELFGPAPPQSTRSAFEGLFPPQPATARPIVAPPPVRRKVFFSFYYAGDIRRSCIVRKSYMFRKGAKPPSSSFYDRSLWEKSRREGEDSLKSLIRQGMAESSVTCVLAGADTWSRPWVRFEIAHSLWRGNGLFTCFIHNVNDPQHGASQAGYDPLAFMGLQLRSDGRGNVVELNGGEWQLCELMKRPVRWPAWMEKPSVGKLYRLSDFAPAYDYCDDDGYNNLCHWAQEAARAAGRR